MTSTARPTTGLTASDRTLLDTLLAAEHAAVYGYAVLGARLGVAARREAVSAQDSHRARRDQLTAVLAADVLTGGAEPAAAEPAYDVAVTGPAAALALAVRLEEGLAVRWRDLAGGTDDRELRRLAVSALQEVAARATGWRLQAGTQPATVALPGTP